MIINLLITIFVYVIKRRSWIIVKIEEVRFMNKLYAIFIMSIMT